MSEKYKGYLCGPTINRRLHLGNFKTFFKSINSFKDRFRGQNKKLIVNITDIGESVYEAAKTNQRGPLLESYVNTEVRKFIKLLSLLDLKPWSLKVVRTSSYIKQINSVINQLNEKWANSPKELIVDKTGVYPDPKSNIGYLWRSGSSFNKLYSIKSPLSGTKITGIPGWHIECATIISKHIKEDFVHYGGADLKNIHHQNESVILETVLPDVAIEWNRTPVIIVKTPTSEGLKEQKMSKSLGNTVDLLKNIKDIKYFKNFLASCSSKSNTYVNILELEKNLIQTKVKPLNLKKRNLKKVYRLIKAREIQKKQKNYKNADYIRGKLLNNYDLKDLSTRTQIFKK